MPITCIDTCSTLGRLDHIFKQHSEMAHPNTVVEEEAAGRLERSEAGYQMAERLVCHNLALLEENKKLRALLAGKDVAAPQVFRFMDLPKDIRLNVYDYVLKPGKVTLQFKKEYAGWGGDSRYAGMTGPVHAQTQLFQISKEVRDEALPLYLAQNMFIYPHIPSCSLGTLSMDMYYGESCAAHMRSLSVAFDFRCTQKIHNQFFGTREQAELEQSAGAESDVWWKSSKVERQEELHEGAVGFIECSYDSICQNVRLLKRLDYLQVNVRNAVCGWGCCRMVSTVASQLFDEDQPWANTPRLLEVLGVHGEQEKDDFLVEKAKNPCFNNTQLVFK